MPHWSILTSKYTQAGFHTLTDLCFLAFNFYSSPSPIELLIVWHFSLFFCASQFPPLPPETFRPSQSTPQLFASCGQLLTLSSSMASTRATRSVAPELPSQAAITFIEWSVRGELVESCIQCSKTARRAMGRKIFVAILNDGLGLPICQSEVILFICPTIFHMFYCEAACAEWLMSSLFCHWLLNGVHLSVSYVYFTETNVSHRES